MILSYNGWAASSNPAAIGIVHFEPIEGYDFPGGVKGGDVEAIFTYLVRQLDKRVEPIEEYPPGDEWGYYFRANVNNPSQLSCHASGTAIDYNATQHPNRVPYTWTREQVREIHKIIDDELDGVVKWLEGWDEMHFEVRGTAHQVAVVADRIRDAAQPPPPPPTLPPLPPKEDALVTFYYVVPQKRWYCIRPWAPHVRQIDGPAAFDLAEGGATVVKVDRIETWNTITKGVV